MNIKFFSIIIFLIMLINIVLGQDAISVAKKSFPFTVSIVMQDQFKKPLSLGSGFIVSPGKIVTNIHVVEGAYFGEVIEDETGNTHKIEGYTLIDKKNDLILLSVPSYTKNGIVLCDSLPVVGQKIFAIGNPKGLSGTISEGIISGIRVLENNDLFQITAPISPGSSGGPVLNNNGEVIGVSVASYTSGQNLNFAIPVKYVKNLMNNDKNVLVKLNIVKPQVKSTEVVPNENVFISDIVWNYGAGGDYFEQYLRNLSVTNLSENTICCIQTVAIIYKNNLPIDYCEFTLFSNYEYDNKSLGIGAIEPFLGKSITLDDGTIFQNYRCRSYKKYSRDSDNRLNFNFNKNVDEKVVFRILDYTILK